MSQEALKIIDELLDVLGQAAKGNAGSAQIANGPVATGPYLESADSATEGMTLRVTTDLARLTQCWQESELGPNDELDSYVGCVGKVMEIEEDDETVQLRWANLDTVWIPARACQDAQGAKETLPGATVSWLSPSDAKDQDTSTPASVILFTSIEQVQLSTTVRVTTDLETLKAEWAKAELGPNDSLQDYLGCVGKVMEIEEDDDTLQLRWENLDSCWIPACACGDANGAEPTLPGGQVADWLSPSQDQDDGKEREVADGPLLEAVSDVAVGQRVKVTGSVEILTNAWAEAELGPNDELAAYCGCVGEVREIEEDDDTLQLRWGNLDTCWIPVTACYVTEEECSIPSKKADWIA